MEDFVRSVKAVADIQRLRVLALVKHAGECCVCEIQETLELSWPTTSRCVTMLENAGWLSKRREGKWNHYRLADLTGERKQLRDALLCLAGQTDQAKTDALNFEARNVSGTACAIDSHPEVNLEKADSK